MPAIHRRAVSEGPRKRAFYNEAFKLQVVKSALKRPPTNRIKPTCARFPGIEPCQVSPEPRVAVHRDRRFRGSLKLSVLLRRCPISPQT